MTDPASPVEWYYAAAGGPTGPRTASELEAMIRGGAIGPDTLLWRRPLEAWAPAATMREFSALFVPAPAVGAAGAWTAAVAGAQGVAAPGIFQEARPATAGHEPPTVKPSPPRPWVRFFARRADMYLMAVVLGMLAALLFDASFEGVEGKLLDFVLGLVAGALMGTLCIPRFGTTPGKWLLSTRVVRADGGRPTFGQAASREAMVLWRGLGLGIPIVTLLTHFNAYTELTDNGRASWDRELELRVVHEPLRPARVAGFVLLCISLVGLLVIGLVFG